MNVQQLVVARNDSGKQLGEDAEPREQRVTCCTPHQQQQEHQTCVIESCYPTAHQQQQRKFETKENHQRAFIRKQVPELLSSALKLIDHYERDDNNDEDSDFNHCSPEEDGDLFLPGTDNIPRFVFVIGDHNKCGNYNDDDDQDDDESEDILNEEDLQQISIAPWKSSSTALRLQEEICRTLRLQLQQQQGSISDFDLSPMRPMRKKSCVVSELVQGAAAVVDPNKDSLDEQENSLNEEDLLQISAAAAATTTTTARPSTQLLRQQQEQGSSGDLDLSPMRPTRKKSCVQMSDNSDKYSPEFVQKLATLWLHPEKLEEGEEQSSSSDSSTKSRIFEGLLAFAPPLTDAQVPAITSIMNENNNNNIALSNCNDIDFDTPPPLPRRQVTIDDCDIIFKREQSRSSVSTKQQQQQQREQQIAKPPSMPRRQVTGDYREGMFHHQQQQQQPPRGSPKQQGREQELAKPPSMPHRQPTK